MLRTAVRFRKSSEWRDQEHVWRSTGTPEAKIIHLFPDPSDFARVIDGYPSSREPTVSFLDATTVAGRPRGRGCDSTGRLDSREHRRGRPRYAGCTRDRIRPTNRVDDDPRECGRTWFESNDRIAVRGLTWDSFDRKQLVYPELGGGASRIIEQPNHPPPHNTVLRPRPVIVTSSALDAELRESLSS